MLDLIHFELQVSLPKIAFDLLSFQSCFEFVYLVIFDGNHYFGFFNVQVL
jgi:hypothetical protein